MVSALTMSVFLPKRITLAESQKNCSKSNLRKKRIYNCTISCLETADFRNRTNTNLNGSSVQNSTEKACPLVQLPLQDGKHTALKRAELSST